MRVGGVGGGVPVDEPGEEEAGNGADGDDRGDNGGRGAELIGLERVRH